MNQNILSRSACNALRGLAIIGIFLHNYCHWLGPIVKENEYQFFQHNTDWLLQVMANPDINLPVHLLSFFGGVSTEPTHYFRAPSLSDSAIHLSIVSVSSIFSRPICAWPR